MINNIRKKTFIIILIYLVTGCQSFEKEFILPLPAAQAADQITAIGFTARWKKVTGASSYEIDVALDPEFAQIVSNYQSRPVDSTLLAITNLEANTTYYYRVRAKIANQTSKNSNVIEATTLALDTPIVFPATEVSATGFRIQWKKMPIVSFYYVDVALDEGFRNLVDNYNNVEVSPSDTSLLVSNVTVNKQYFYRIRVKQSNSFSEYSNIEMVSTSTLPQPVALSATNLQLTSFTANWEAMPEALSYQVDIAFDALFQNKLAGYDNRTVNTNNLVVPNLDANTTYFYRVRAVNNESISNNSNVITVTTANLNPPVATSATLVQSGSFQANWNSVANAASYLLDVALDAQFTKILTNYNGVVVVGNTTLVQSIDASTTYYYRVRAQGLNATSDFSNTIQLTTNLLAAPTANAATNQKAFSFMANWQAQADISLYLLDVATDNGFTNFVTGYQAKEVAGTSHTVTNLDFKTTYYYRLRAKRLTKESANSNMVTVNACISATCRLDKLELIDNTNANANTQEYTYDAQNRLTSVLSPNRNNLRFDISYTANNVVQSISIFESNILRYNCNYAYSGGLLQSITLVRPNNTVLEYWAFTYNGQGQRMSWSIHPDASQASLRQRFDLTYDANGNVTEVRNKNGTLFRKYAYDDKLSPLAIFDPDLCFFVGTNRDRWRGNPNLEAVRGFMPIHNIVREEIPASGIPVVVFLFSFNSKDVSINQDGIFKAAYTFSGCDF